jgi:gliding motility-associated-like protein
LRENETFDLAPHVPVSDKARYYRITHLNSCVSAPAAWESQAVRWVLVPALRAIASVWNCAQEELEYHYTLDSGGLPVLEARATLLQGSQILESRVLPAQNGSGRGVFKNPHAPGAYEVRIEIQLAAGSGGVFNFTREFSFEMESPALSLSGPPSVGVGQTSRFETSPAFGLVSNPSQVLWSHQNESLQWVSSGNSSLQSQFAWASPGTYGVRARAVWYPSCFADADTSIEVQDAAPELRVEFGGKFSCSETGQMSGVLHLQDHSFKILGIEGRILQSGNLVKSFSIDPALRDGEFRLDRPEAPGQYLLEIRVIYEILPGVQKTLLRQLPFQVNLPAMSLTGPAYLRLGEAGAYRAEHTGVSAPRIYWSYPDDGGVFYSAVPGGLTRSLMWKDRGSHEVTVDAIWSDACRVSAKVNTRVMGEETVFFPDAFTPNDDQTNDRYGPKGQDMQITRFEIYDRWGAKVYSAVPADIERLQGWDGTVQGKMAPDGVFVCVAEYESPVTREKKTYRGTVTLLR